MLGLSLGEFLARALTLVIALTVHEFSHAWAADSLGDDTPRLNGRLTLNPLAHLDPIGSIFMLLAGFGWARPVPVNPIALSRRTRAGMMLVAAAGPFSNFLLALFAAIPIRAGWVSAFPGPQALGGPSFLLSQFILLNLFLLFFNLLPIFPLDGEKVAEYFLPYGGREFLYRIRPYGFLILSGLLILGRTGFDLLGLIVASPAFQVYGLLVT